ncbi:MAG: hydroxyacylglutathione hydrolase [Methylotenera sp. RIFCSPLOWO2_02_FULL_45_14]|nr:MAG: hydroxyacylglutathione hydrolase [Methylotenera sp. RIFCSPLOWO2_02_FULL_45_14]
MIVDMQPHLQIISIPAFKDNYIWLIHNGSQAIVVDPGDALPVLNTLSQCQLTLHTILITHHHHDHIGGVNALVEKYPNVQIFAPKVEQYDFKHTQVSEPDVINLAAFNIEIALIDLPGHTLGHVAYYVAHHDHPWLFCGDTLFGAGCGRLFEGSPAQMLHSLQKLAALPAATQVFCTHEYTLHNIGFALTLEPNNSALRQRQHDTLELRNRQLPSLPSTIALELATNPFLRCNSEEIQSSLQLKNATLLQAFSLIREMRNLY